MYWPSSMVGAPVRPVLMVYSSRPSCLSWAKSKPSHPAFTRTYASTKTCSETGHLFMCGHSGAGVQVPSDGAAPRACMGLGDAACDWVAAVVLVQCTRSSGKVPEQASLM